MKTEMQNVIEKELSQAQEKINTKILIKCIDEKILENGDYRQHLIKNGIEADYGKTERELKKKDFDELKQETKEEYRKQLTRENKPGQDEVYEE